MLNQIFLFFFILKIQIHFGFLFRRGYRLKQKKVLPMGDYRIKLESPDNAVIIFSEFGEIWVGIAPLGTDIFNIDSLSHNMLIFEEIVSFITNGTVRYKPNLQIKELSKELENYLDVISPFFGENFEKFRTEIKSKKNNDY